MGRVSEDFMNHLLIVNLVIHRGPNETGMARLALDDNDAAVRTWMVEEMRTLGCKVTVDAMGNIFAVRPGKKEGNPIGMGSHLDTQPTGMFIDSIRVAQWPIFCLGGRYDGCLGVMAAIEVLRTLNDHKIETEYPVAAIDWTKYASSAQHI